MKSWAFVTARRKLSLNHYLRNVNTLEKALAQFKDDNIEPPSIELITVALEENKPPVKKPGPKRVNKTVGTKPKRRAKNQNKRRKPLKKGEDSSGEFDEIVIINTEASTTKD